jgi:hypothetical protein
LTAYSAKLLITFWRISTSAVAATARIASRTEANSRWPIEMRNVGTGAVRM